MFYSRKIGYPADTGDEQGVYTKENAALTYASQGWKVLPLYEPDADGLCSCWKGAKCRSPGKHPRISGGVNEASSDPRTIRRWWRRWPAANIGIATGSSSGVWVLDIDLEGLEYEDVERLYGPFETGAVVRSGGRGWHIYFATGGRTVSCAVGVAPGVDIRGEGGYIVAPPSVHVSHPRYVWSAA